MVDLKGLIWTKFILGGYCGLERTDFELFADLLCQITVYKIENCCLSVSVCVSVGCDMGQFVAELASDQLS